MLYALYYILMVGHMHSARWHSQHILSTCILVLNGAFTYLWSDAILKLQSLLAGTAGDL